MAMGMEHDGPVSVNIGNICGGAVPERFEAEIAKLMANISDLNTDPEAKRSLVLEFEFKPSPDRKAAVVRFKCKTKLAGMSGVNGSVFMSTAHGTIKAFTEDPRQTKLFASQTPVTDNKM